MRARQQASAICAAAIAAMAGIASVQAAPFTFDADSTAANGITAGDGTWDSITANWYDAGVNAPWPAANNTAVFAGADGAYAINISNAAAPSAVGGLTFSNSGYTLSAASAVTLIRSGAGAATISVASGKVATLGANVTYAGTAGTGSDLIINGGGTLRLAGATLSSTNAATSPIRIGGSAPNTTTLDIQAGGSLVSQHQSSNNIFVGGVLKVSGGDVTIRNLGTTNGTASSLFVGYYSSSATPVDYGTGTLTLETGSITISRNQSTGTGNNSGSLFIGRKDWSSGSTNTDATGTVNLNGGTLSIPNASGANPASANGGIILTGGSYSNGQSNATLNFNGTAVTIGSSSTTGIRFFNVSNQSYANATVNLDAGVVTTPIITTGLSGNTGVSINGYFNFNGGTLRANADQASYFGAVGSNLAGMTTTTTAKFRANVKTGGAIIDTNGFNIGIGQQLLHDTTAGAPALDGGLLKIGAGTLTLSGASTYTGPTKVSGGTLKIAAAERIANSSSLILDGGTFDTGGVSETMANLGLAQNSSIDFGSAASVLTLAGLGAFDTTRTLSLLGWSGLSSGGGVDQLFVGNTTLLTGDQLAAIQFVNPTNYTAGTYAATQLVSGEIVALVPEPATLVAAGAMGLVLLSARRRRVA